MPTFSYTAISPQGEKTKGTEVAENERELGRVLHEKGYILTTTKEAGKKKGSSSLSGFLSLARNVSLTDKLLFTRNLQVMVGAGIPLPKSLDVLAEQTTNKRFRKILLDVKTKVMEGESLSASMESYSSVFPELFTNMVKVGEESGTLENVLSQITLQLDREHNVKSKVLGALMYPAVIMFAMVAVGILMLTLVIPKLAATFKDLGVDLPLTTRIIIGAGLFMEAYWYFVVPILLILLFLAYRALRTAPGKRLLDTTLLHTPVFSGIVRKTNSALMTRTVSSLTTAGVPIVRALEITSKVVGNVYFQESLQVSAEGVRKGTKFSAILQDYKGLYPVMVVQMIEVGEETGETGKILAKLADFFESEVDQVTKNLTAIIEPILMLVIGSMVGFFAISMIQPMYSMLSSIK